MQAVGMSACAAGHRVVYTTSAQLLIRLTAALADKSLTELLRRYAAWDLLLVDEFGFALEPRADLHRRRILRHRAHRPQHDTCTNTRTSHVHDTASRRGRAGGARQVLNSV